MPIECGAAPDWLVQADLEDFFGVTLSAALADQLLAIAQRRVRLYTGQCLTLVADDVEFVDGTGRDAFRLLQRPVTAITELQEDGSVVEPGTYPDHDWMISAGSGVVVRQGDTWPVGRRNIRVTYSHGWDPDVNFPEDIRLVSLSFARRVYEIWGQASPPSPAGSLRSETMGSYSYEVADAAALEAIGSTTSFAVPERMILDHYRMGGPKSGSKS